MKWFIIISGTCMSGAAARLFFKDKEKRPLNVTEIIPQSENKTDEKDEKDKKDEKDEKDETVEQMKWANPTNKISMISKSGDTAYSGIKFIKNPY